MADFQSRLSELESRGVRVIAASVDSRDDAEKIRSELKLEFSIAYGLDARETAAAIGAFYHAEDEEPYLHATAFILDEAGKIVMAVYSTGSRGRFTVGDCLR